MFARKSELKPAFGQHRHVLIEPSNLAIIIALAAALVLLLAAVTPAGQVLPIFALGAMAASVGCGLIALLSNRRDAAKEHPAWHIAGVFMLLGCIAGMLSGSEQVLQLFGLEPAKS